MRPSGQIYRLQIHYVGLWQCCCPRGLEAKSAGLSLGLDTYGLGLAFKQDQDLINFYCAISATKLWLLYITEKLRLVRDAVRTTWMLCQFSVPRPEVQRIHCPRFDMMHGCTLLSTSCSHGTVFVCTSDICAGWKGVQPWWHIYDATSCQTGRICVIIPPCVLGLGY